METLRITIVGSDDGIVFWTLFGEWLSPTTGELTVDFSPKGGPADFARSLHLRSRWSR